MRLSRPEHVTVCIPTYQRTAMLARCLESLGRQERDGFTWSIVVVDNDADASARDVVSEWRRRSGLPVEYEVEPERNISRARNRALARAGGELVAFIDDDEIAEAAWLRELVATCRRSGADGVFGPVIPLFQDDAPAWLRESGVFVRPSFPTGTRLHESRDMRTGNVLFHRRVLADIATPFDPRLGRSGGEDTDFFARLCRAGRSFVWCDEARVHEAVPRERQRLAYCVRRALGRGVTAADREPALGLGTARSMAAVVLYTAGLPFLLAGGRHLAARYFLKDCDHVAKLLARVGLRLVRERG